MIELKIDDKEKVSGKCIGWKGYNSYNEFWSFSCGGNSIEVLVKPNSSKFQFSSERRCKIKNKSGKVLVCDGQDDRPEVTTTSPAGTECRCGGHIEQFSKNRFDIKCLDVKQSTKSKGKKKGWTHETWQFTCPKDGKSKTYVNPGTNGPKCPKIAGKAKRFCT